MLLLSCSESSPIGLCRTSPRLLIREASAISPSIDRLPLSDGRDSSKNGAMSGEDFCEAEALRELRACALACAELGMADLKVKLGADCGDRAHVRSVMEF